MTHDPSLWAGLFLAVTTALLLAPLYPAWKEWLQPQDSDALSLTPQAISAAPLATSHFRLTADMPMRPLIEATESIEALPGSHFEKLAAPRIDFGEMGSGVTHAAHHASEARHVDLHHLPHATAWGHGWRVDGDCRIPAAHRLKGPLVVTGALSVEPDCLIEGDIKAHGDIRLAPRTVVTGALVGEKNMALDNHCRVQGPVVCENHLSLGRAVVLGQAQQATSVSAERISSASGVRVHGSIWARSCGNVT